MSNTRCYNYEQQLRGDGIACTVASDSPAWHSMATQHGTAHLVRHRSVHWETVRVERVGLRPQLGAAGKSQTSANATTAAAAVAVQ